MFPKPISRIHYYCTIRMQRVVHQINLSHEREPRTGATNVEPDQDEEREREKEGMASARAQGALRLKSLTRSWSSSALPATISPLIGLEKTAPRTRDDSDMEGTLRDVNVGVKDLFDLEEHVCGFGSPAFKAQFPEPAESDAAAVTALRRAGAHGFAPLHMDEMAFSLFGENANLGTPINFKSPSRVPGGSSSGCGSAVAGGLVDIALGSDTAGSIRVPASFCGAWGFRPTHGRVSVQGSRALAHSLDTVGLVARNAELLEKGMKVLLDTARDVEHAVPDDAESIFGGTYELAFSLSLSLSLLSIELFSIPSPSPHIYTWMHGTRVDACS